MRGPVRAHGRRVTLVRRKREATVLHTQAQSNPTYYTTPHMYSRQGWRKCCKTAGAHAHIYIHLWVVQTHACMKTVQGRERGRQIWTVHVYGNVHATKRVVPG